jgi:hypothetical protein
MTDNDLKRKIAEAKISRGKKCPEELRQAIDRYADIRRADGGTLKQVADELGIKWYTLMRWRSGKSKKKTLVPVSIIKSPLVPLSEVKSREIIIRLASGITVEGLDIGKLAQLIRSLS